MKRVERGHRVTYSYSVDEKGHPTGAGAGLVLDRAFTAGTWYVMPTGAQRAVVVKALDMVRQ